jgi:hypothetical protein
MALQVRENRGCPFARPCTSPPTFTLARISLELTVHVSSRLSKGYRRRHGYAITSKSSIGCYVLNTSSMLCRSPSHDGGTRSVEDMRHEAGLGAVSSVKAPLDRLSLRYCCLLFRPFDASCTPTMALFTASGIRIDAQSFDLRPQYYPAVLSQSRVYSQFCTTSPFSQKNLHRSLSS